MHFPTSCYISLSQIALPWSTITVNPRKTRACVIESTDEYKHALHNPQRLLLGTWMIQFIWWTLLPSNVIRVYFWSIVLLLYYIIGQLGAFTVSDVLHLWCWAFYSVLCCTRRWWFQGATGAFHWSGVCWLPDHAVDPCSVCGVERSTAYVVLGGDDSEAQLVHSIDPRFVGSRIML